MLRELLYQAKKADYLLGLKGNQGLFHDKLTNFFEQAHAAEYEDVVYTRHQTNEKGHGRIEQRTVCVVNDLEWLPQRDALIEVRSVREIKGKVEKSTRYYISSRKGSAKQFGEWIRDHWSIENSLHWVADVVFNEDASLARADHAAENMSLIRRLAMNIIHVVDPERGMADARRNAKFAPSYLRGLLGKMFIK